MITSKNRAQHNLILLVLKTYFWAFIHQADQTNMTTRQSYQLKAGNLANMKLVTAQLEDPAADEVQIEVKAIGLNFADVFAIWGLYAATPKGEFIPGLEYAGVVSKTGSAVTTVKEGDRIMGVTRFGAYTTHLNIDHRYVIPLPADWSFAEGSAYLVQMLTAYYAMLNLGDLKKGQTVLIHSAAGGVGTHAVRIAKKLGCYTIGTVGNASKLDYLAKEGYDKSIVRNTKTFRQDLENALDGKELNVIMECIGGKIFKIGYDVLAQQGRVIIYGQARYAAPGDRPNYLRLIWLYLTRPKIDPQQLPQDNKGILGFNLIWLYERVHIMEEILKEVEAMNLPKPTVGHTFPYDQFHEAVRLFQTGKTVGKVVITT